jgi:hypothetical protein
MQVVKPTASSRLTVHVLVGDASIHLALLLSNHAPFLSNHHDPSFYKNSIHNSHVCIQNTQDVRE